jgi:hypothetical protein
MNRTSTSIFILGLLVFTVATEVQAAGEASLYIGRTGVGDLKLENMTTFGGSIGAFSSFVGVELGFEYSPTTNFAIGPIELGASLGNFMGNVVFQIPIGAFYPYGTVGYGVVSGRVDLDLPQGFVGKVGAFNFGLGGKLYFSDHIGIRFDYRRFALQTSDDDPELAVPFTGIRIDTNPDLNRFMVGAAFRW